MSSINSINGNTPVQKIVTQPVQKQVPTDAPAQVRVTDRLELSGVGHLLQTLKTNDIRADKVASVKSAIEAGTYETEEKLNAAIDRLLDDVT
jgi:negative regulator of flagellin synthesis FlgM